MTEFDGDQGVEGSLKPAVQSPALHSPNLPAATPQPVASLPPPVSSPPKTTSPAAAKTATPFSAQLKDKKNWPLVAAFVALVFGLGFLVGFHKSDVSILIGIMVITNSVAQMAIDFYREENKPFFSALARTIPVVATACALYAKS